MEAERRDEGDLGSQSGQTCKPVALIGQTDDDRFRIVKMVTFSMWCSMHMHPAATLYLFVQDISFHKRRALLPTSVLYTTLSE